MKNKKIILITGMGGQLASELFEISKKFSEYDILFSGIADMDITDERAVMDFFHATPLYACINTAAYTAVDAAESHESEARKINVDGTRYLARACQKHSTLMVHISTDFVFDGEKSTPYTEEDIPHPLNIYAQTKLESERAVLEECERTFIVRTAWLYSGFGNNFVKTIAKKARERGKLSVVADQIGTPTNAADLTDVLMRMIRIYDVAVPDVQKTLCGIYHYTNEGDASWYDFAQAIIEYSGIVCELTPISTDEYPLPARRPAYSVLDKKKIRDSFGIAIPDWRESLKRSILEKDIHRHNL